MSTPPAPPPEGEVTNPLGGRIHSIKTLRKPRNTWPGFATMVRVCPECDWENDESDRFCVNCAASIEGITPTPSATGLSAATARRELHDEQVDLQRKRRPNVELSGGFLAIGAVFVLFAVLMEMAPVIRIPVWIVGIGLGLTGIWHIRANAVALRRWGAVLASCAVATILALALQTRQLPGAELPSPPTSETATVAVVTAGTPVPGDTSLLSGSVPMAGVTALHDNVIQSDAPATTPDTLWTHDVGAESYGTPILDNGVLFLIGKDGVLHAVDAATGDSRWNRPLTNYAVRAAPAVDKGVVFAGTGFAFVALNAATGEQLWSTPVPYVGHASPTIADGVVYVPSQQGWMFALDASSGSILWQIPTEGVVFGAAAVGPEGIVYGTDTGVLYNVRSTNGQVKWRKRLGGPIYASPTIMGKSIFVTTETGTTQALDTTTGDQLWAFEHGSSDSLAVRSDILVISSSDGGVYGLDPTTGLQKWLYPSGKRTLTSPVIAGNQVLVGADNTLLAIDINSGAAGWYVLAGDTIVSPATVADGLVFFTSQDGFLNSVGAKR